MKAIRWAGRERDKYFGPFTFTPSALRQWLHINFGWDIYEWDDDDIRF